LQRYADPFYRTAEVAWKKWSKGGDPNLETLKQSLSEHNVHVRDIAGGRLLEWSVTEGWGPLCQFLGKDAPDSPFPKVNEGAFVRKMLDKVILMRGIMILPRAILTVGIPIAAAFWVWRMRWW
jgi:hypothetical protein